MRRRSFMWVLVAGGAVISLPACESMPTSATTPWRNPGADQTDPRLRSLAWALLAPNPHNLQSWLADIREPGLIRLSVDLQRLLPATDPPNRQILIGCGAFLELLCLAAAQQGYRADVTLLPEGDYAAGGVDVRPFATVRLTPDPATGPDPLFAAVSLRRTNRSPYSSQVPEAQALAQLAASAQRPSTLLAAGAAPTSAGETRPTAAPVNPHSRSRWPLAARGDAPGHHGPAGQPLGMARQGAGVPGPWRGQQTKGGPAWQDRGPASASLKSPRGLPGQAAGVERHVVR